jgi:hypothetical protein
LKGYYSWYKYNKKKTCEMQWLNFMPKSQNEVLPFDLLGKLSYSLYSSRYIVLFNYGFDVAIKMDEL